MFLAYSKYTVKYSAEPTLDEGELATLPFVLNTVGVPVQEDVVATSLDANRERRALRADRAPDRCVR